MQSQSVPIDRRFTPVSDDDLRDPDRLWPFDGDPPGMLRWSDLLNKSPVVLLGEGRSGKTHEFKRQVDELRSKGSFALFVPLEALHDQGFVDSLSLEEEAELDDWKATPDRVGYFFLDAIDELKLRNGTLYQALNKFHRSISPHLARARVYVSCRPGDLNSQIDLRQIERFVVKRSVGPRRIAAGDGEAEFVALISGTDSDGTREGGKSKSDELYPGVSASVISILPLAHDEVRLFAETYAPEYASAFCAHMENHDVWHLYRLPADISGALDQLKSGQPIGTLEHQLQFGIQQKLGEALHKRGMRLTVERAQIGAERLALAMTLLKRRSIMVDSIGEPDTVNINDILADWTPDEQRELTGKALFIPSGVSKVSFHHRSTQEFLAARRLHALLHRGLPRHDLKSLLFDKIAGEEIVKPSMAPITAWLALWHTDVRRIVSERDPGVMFAEGLPSAMTLEMRAEILRSYVVRYANKKECRRWNWRSDLRRVVHPDLSPVVRELWKVAYTGYHSRELMLVMIWLAPMVGCGELALAAALDSNLPESHQTIACWCVLACGNVDQKQAIAKNLTEHKFRESVARAILPRLVPDVISVEDFLSLINNLSEVSDTAHDLGYSIFKTATSASLGREEKVLLRTRLADAIWQTRRQDGGVHGAHSKKDHYVDGLIACCLATLPEANEELSEWARDLAVSLHFGRGRQSIIAKQETKNLQAVLEGSPQLREAYFWACVAIVGALEEEESALGLVVRVLPGTHCLFRFDTADQHWLLNALGPEAPTDRREVAYFAIHGSCDWHVTTALASEIAKRIKDRPDLQADLERRINPVPREPSEWELRDRKRSELSSRKERERLADWLSWRNQVLSDSDFLMTKARRLDVLNRAQEIIELAWGSPSAHGQWDSDLIARTMSPAFLDRFRQELSAYWRDPDVLGLGECSPGARGDSRLALSAVKAESEVEGWAVKLSHAEAVRATRIACLELNGFPSFIEALEAKHPMAVADVISAEAVDQIQEIEYGGEATILHDVLYHGTGGMKTAVAKAIAPVLSVVLTCPKGNRYGAINYAIKIVADSGDACAQGTAVKAIISALDERSELPCGSLLSLLIRLDVQQGCDRVLTASAELTSLADRQSALELFAKVFGDRMSRINLDVHGIPGEPGVALLRDLVLRAYQVVRPYEDILHQGTYNPDTRDAAQEARSFLFEALVSVKSIARGVQKPGRPESTTFPRDYGRLPGL